MLGIHHPYSVEWEGESGESGEGVASECAGEALGVDVVRESTQPCLCVLSQT